ncbi:thioredoxin domain-containing protein [Candidatus Woesearchaeota archaeon]|nr:thioredoxin domain-containing protein [Candidatus Woesearchaeota archaeon]
MVKRVFPFLFFAVFLGALLSGCSPTFCSTPYILSGGDCCLDKNQDTLCDAEQDLPKVEQQEYVPIPVSQEQQISSRPSLLTTEEGILLTIDPDDDPFQGKEDANVYLIEFGDYVDSGSQRFHQEVLPKLLETYGSKLTYVFRNFPETNNENAQLAAEASECADEQGKFWAYHDFLFTRSHRLTLSSLRQLAAEAGLNVDAFEACFFSHRYTTEVLKDKDDGLAYGVSYTPTFFLNNQKIIGFKALDQFDALLQDLFYEDFRAEQGVTITARSTGLAYAILAGPAALEPSLEQSPYSNRLALVDAVFSVSAQDKTAGDSGMSRDTASLAVTYSPRRGGGLTGKEVYTLELTQLLTEGVSHSYFGGVGIEVPVHGNTGIGTRYLPRSEAYLTLWGLADIKKNGEPFVQDAFLQFLITRGIRDENNNLLSKQEEDDIEAYLLVSARDNQQLPFADGFLYLFWPEVNLRQL